jgi:hypothetical protein
MCLHFCCCCLCCPPALLGAQFIECCDIVLTADLVPVCRHEPVISNTTNADQLFPDRVSPAASQGVPRCTLYP